MMLDCNENVLVKVDKASKKFCKNFKKSLFYGLQDIFRELAGMSNSSRLRDGEFWAVKDVSFQLRRGECLGLIGHNGAGKSTLLKMLNGLIKPDRGKIAIKGKVAALIELGAGFNPILTGRENIYNNASVLGFSKTEINNKLKEIIDFAEVREFIDSPVQTYSSGMKVRLGFAIAVQMEPDVLIIDEVLAVGDLRFRAKSFNAIYDLVKKSAVIFVSHNIPQVARISSHVLCLNRGEAITYTDDVAVGIHTYFSLLSGDSVGSKFECEEIKIEKFFIKTEGNETPKVEFGGTLEFEVEGVLKKSLSDLTICLNFIDSNLQIVAQNSSFFCGQKISVSNTGYFYTVCKVEGIRMSPGVYGVALNIFEEKHNKILAKDYNNKNFEVVGGVHGIAPFQLNLKVKNKSL